MIYSCKKCTGAGSDSPTMLDAIEDLQTSTADLKSVIAFLNVSKEEVPKIKDDISKLFGSKVALILPGKANW